jgi:hypothetical protein
MKVGTGGVVKRSDAALIKDRNLYSVIYMNALRELRGADRTTVPNVLVKDSRLYRTRIEARDDDEQVY